MDDRMPMTQDDPFDDEWSAPTPDAAHGVNEQDAPGDTPDITPVHQNGNDVPQQRFDNNHDPRSRHNVGLTDRQRMPPPPKPSFIRTLSVRSEHMRKDSLNQRADADAAFKAHQTARGNLHDAVVSQEAATARLKAVERQVINKRMNNSLLETKLTEQITEIADASNTQNVYNILYDAVMVKLDDLQNDQESLHELELELAENLKVVSQMEVMTSRVRVSELRSKLRARRAKLQVVERDAEISAVESALEDWASVKTWASRQSTVECSKLEHLRINIDPNLEGQDPPTKRRRRSSTADTKKLEDQEVCPASPKRRAPKRRFSNFLTDLPGYLGVFGATAP